MIYAVEPDRYPAVDAMQTETDFTDQNDQPWKVAVSTSGALYVRYDGDPTFRDSTFEPDGGNGETIRVKNTGCLMLIDGDFETYCTVRGILKENYTDDIWEAFESMFVRRFADDLALLESEVDWPVKLPEDKKPNLDLQKMADGLAKFIQPAVEGKKRRFDECSAGPVGATKMAIVAPEDVQFVQQAFDQLPIPGGPAAPHVTNHTVTVRGHGGTFTFRFKQEQRNCQTAAFGVSEWYWFLTSYDWKA